RVVGLDPAAVFAASHLLDPGRVVEVPADRLREPGLEGLARRPAETRADLRRIHGVAAVVARTIGDVGDERAVAGGARPQALQPVADGVHDIDVAPLGGAADVVRFAGHARLEHAAHGGAVIA